MEEKRSMTAEEKRWAAEEDARALRRASEIMGDKARHNAAKAHIKGEISNMQKVLGSGDPGGKKLGPKPPAPRRTMQNEPTPKKDMKQFPKPPKAKGK